MTAFLTVIVLLMLKDPFNEQIVDNNRSYLKNNRYVGENNRANFLRVAE